MIQGIRRWVEPAAGLTGLAWILAVILAHVRGASAEAAPAGAAVLGRGLLTALVAVPWLLAAGGFVAGLRVRRFGAMAPLLAGAAGLAVGMLGPVRLPILWPLALLGLAVLLRAPRVPAHPMAYLGVFASGFVLTGLGYVLWITLLLTAPRGS